MSKSRSTFVLGIIALALFATFFYVIFPWFLQNWLYPASVTEVKNISAWSLKDPEPGIAIRWQKEVILSGVSHQTVLLNRITVLAGGNAVVAVDNTSGERVWALSLPNPQKILALDDGVIVLGLKSRLVLERISEDGNVIWSAEILPRQFIADSLFHVGDVLFISGHEGVKEKTYQVALESGQLIESTPLSVIGANESFLVTSNSESTQLVFMTPDLSKVVFEIKASDLGLQSLRYIAGTDKIILLAQNDRLFGYDPETQREVWSFRFTSLSRPVIDQDRFYMYSPNDEIGIYGLDSATLREKIALDRPKSDLIDRRVQYPLIISPRDSMIIISDYENNHLIAINIE